MERTYGYDAYGNRWVTAGSTNLFVQTPQQESDFAATTNRLTTAFGVSYDAAGNQTEYDPDPAGTLLDWSAAYDGENRQRYFCSRDGGGLRVVERHGGVLLRRRGPAGRRRSRAA